MKLSLASLLVAGAALASAKIIGSHDGMDLVRREHHAAIEKRSMDWGDINLTQDYAIEYRTAHWEAAAKKYSYPNATYAFCENWHNLCVNYAESGTLDEHHSIDCQPTQAGPTIYAFCGGRKKKADGTWSSSATLHDNTRLAMAYAKEVGEYQPWAVIKKKPIGSTKCKAYVKKHPSSGYVC